MIRKAKIAVSLDKELLKEVDMKINKTSIKNRSQALEHMIKKGMGKISISDAVIFLFKYDLNYFQYQYQGELFLQRIMNFLREGGIQRVFILSQQEEKIEKMCKNVDTQGLKIVIKYFPKEIENLPMLYKIKNELEERFLVINGDTLQQFKLSKMIHFFMDSEKYGTCLLISSNKANKYTSLILEGNDIVEIKEKENTQNNIIYGGTAVFNKRVFSLLDEKKDAHMETDLFRKLIQIKELNGFFNYGEYIHMPEIYDLGYRERREKLKKLMKKERDHQMNEEK